MTRHKSFKRFVRARMDKTGESFTAARAQLLAAPEATVATAPAAEPVLPTSDEAIRQRTGRGWEEWFDALDAWDAAERPHREVAVWVAEQLGIDPLAWNAQAITVAYERAHGGRAVGSTSPGSRSPRRRPWRCPSRALYMAWVDEDRRERWLPAAPLRGRTATPPRSARFD